MHDSRRHFLTAALAAGAAAIPALSSAQDPRLVLDAASVNFLLKFEYIQSALYRNAAARFTANDLAPLGASVQSTLLQFRDQEAEHIFILQSLLTRMGMTPPRDCGDRFSRFRTVTDFLQTALALENIGVSAYLGVLPLLRVPQVQSAVASIASVESRHSAFIGLLNGQEPAPAAADTPRTRDEILGLLSPYIDRCAV